MDDLFVMFSVVTTSRSIFAFVLPIQSCTCRVCLHAETSWEMREVVQVGKTCNILTLVSFLYCSSSAGNETQKPRAAGINEAVSPAHVTVLIVTSLFPNTANHAIWCCVRLWDETTIFHILLALAWYRLSRRLQRR